MSAVKLALPKGRLMAETSALLDRADWGLSDYHEGTRSYRLTGRKFPDLQAKIFQEKDIPIQVAVGNYDFGICGLDWVEELTAKYPSSALIRLRDLGFGRGAVYAVAAGNGDAPVLEALRDRKDGVRLVSEYPNLAEAFALKLRLRRFSVFPLWGGAEVYPPESADLALMAAKDLDAPFDHGLNAVGTVLRFSACLIANRDRWERRDLSAILASLEAALPTSPVSAASPAVELAHSVSGTSRSRDFLISPDTVRLALPDGHQQAPTVASAQKGRDTDE